ncbi:MAG: transposase [Acidobacteriota bacterium]
MCATRRKFTREFKLSAVQRLQSGHSVGRVVRESEVNSITNGIATPDT